MERQGKKTKWKATDSAPMDTKQKDDIGVQNQTTHSTKPRTPLVTIILFIIVFLVVAIVIWVAQD